MDDGKRTLAQLEFSVKQLAEAVRALKPAELPSPAAASAVTPRSPTQSEKTVTDKQVGPVHVAVSLKVVSLGSISQTACTFDADFLMVCEWEVRAAREEFCICV